jgi:CRP/FNR family transcriptional regulator, cyclic AMP receptor protein
MSTLEQPRPLPADSVDDMPSRKVGRPREQATFRPASFLSRIQAGKSSRDYRPGQSVFGQGDEADAVFYLAKGKVKLSVVSPRGKEAILGVLGQGAFFGESCLALQPLRLSGARALLASTIVRVEKKTMTALLHREPHFAELFLAYLLSRNLRIEEDLIDQLFNSSEKRLARVLLLLTHFGKKAKPEPVLPKMSQEALASMIGTTRARVSYFMNRFRKLGFIDYGGGALTVRNGLLSVLLAD